MRLHARARSAVAVAAAPRRPRRERCWQGQSSPTARSSVAARRSGGGTMGNAVGPGLRTRLFLPCHLYAPLASLRPATGVALGETIAKQAAIGDDYSASFHQVEFRGMPLKSEKVEAAARTLLLLEELNRHRAPSLDSLHKATVLPQSTVVRLMKSLCALGYAAYDRRQVRYALASPTQ